MSTSILEFENISKSFFAVQALKGVNLKLIRGHILGLVGENGAGKTTLMNILGGVIRSDEGIMKLKSKTYAPKNPADAKKAGIGFIHQELNLFMNLSIADNIFIDGFPRYGIAGLINKKKTNEKTKGLLGSVNMELSPDILLERLSPGERQLVEIAKALSFDAEIIIFDEPTTSLTAKETERLFSIIRRLQAEGKSIIYISHNLGNVLQLADDIAVIKDGSVVATGGRAEFSVSRIISQMVGRDINQIYPARTAKATSEVALEVKELTQRGIVKDINFTLYKGEVVGMFGLMGSGRTELARMIFGLDSFERGMVIVDGKAQSSFSPENCIRQGMAFVTEDRREEGLLMEATVVDNVSLVSLREYKRRIGLGVVDKNRIRVSVQDVVKRLQIKSGPIERDLAKNLSGGNQQKVVISKWLMSKPSVFIMDEPTRGIDVGSKYEIYSIINDLAAQGAGILFISGELEELMGNCDWILVMSNGEIQGHFSREEFDEKQILHAAFKGHREHVAADER